MKRYILISDNQLNKSTNLLQMGGNGEFNEKYIFPYTDYDTKEKRLKKLDEFKKELKSKKKFNGHMYIIGFGAVGRPLLVMLFELINIDPKNVTLIDDRSISVNASIPKGVEIRDNLKIQESNYKDVFKNLKDGDIIVDVCDSVDTDTIVALCQEKGASYINSCIDVWDYKQIKTPVEYSLRYRHGLLDKYNDKLKKEKKINYSAIVSMGCNPGDVSIWVKVGINEIWKKKYNTDKLPKKSFAEMAHELGIQTIHISERDTQNTSIKKKHDEYCNTWSSLAVSYYEELLGCVEATWGTHEDKKHNGMESVANENNYLTWKKIGAYVYAQSWVPIYGRYIGNIVRHDEAFTIGRELTIPNKYCPSVYYVYHPTDETTMSVYELKEKNNEYQTNFRLLTSDITEGNDLLGLTYYLADGTTYFVGSLLNINEAREIYNNKYNDIVNATIVPVVIGYLSGIIYLMDNIAENKKVGLLCPDELPYDEIMNYQLPFLGDFVFVEGNYKMISTNNHFDDPHQIIHGDWTFDKFLIHHD